MNENLIELFNKLVTDPKLLKKFNEQKNMEDLYQFSTSVISGYTIDEFKDFLTDILKSCSAQNTIKEVSPGELECVAGGTNILGSKKLQSLLLGSALVALSSVPAHGLSYDNLNSSCSNNISVSQNNSSENSKLKGKSQSAKNNNSSSTNENSSVADKNANSRSYGNDVANKNANNANSRSSGNNVANKNANNANSRSSGNNVANKNANNANSRSSGNNVANKNANNANSRSSGNDVANKNANNANSRSSNDDKNHANDKNSQNSQVHHEASIISYPAASTITYGQKLSDSRLLGGSADTTGSFEWSEPNKKPMAGEHNFSVRFIPKDRNIPPKMIMVRVKVEKATPKIIRKPEATSITYGQNLKNSNLFDGESNIRGTFSWKNGKTFLDAGSHKEEVIFTPYDTENYEKITLHVNVYVNKATPHLDKNSFTQKYKPNSTLGDISLPRGWKWQNPYMRLDNIGKFQAKAFYDETWNYSYRCETVFIEINKADPEVPSFSVVYSPYSSLRDIHLPRGWYWSNPDEIPNTFKGAYQARFNANDAGTPFYHSKDSVDIPIFVHKATPKVFSWAQQGSEIVHGTDLTTVPLFGGFADVAGTFRFADSSSQLRAGNHMCRVVFTPFDPNYKRIEGSIPVQISKNMTPMHAPIMDESKVIRKDTSLDFHKLSEGGEIEFSKDGGMTWQPSPVFTNLSPDTEYYFVARYRETDSRCAGHISGALRVLTKSSAPAAPDAPVLKSKTSSKIVLESNEKLEYSIDGGKNWQSQPEFKHLKRKTDYLITTRFKETESSMPSNQSEAISVTTNRFPRPLSWLFG